eukprot:Rhum_TRINITY_DN8079_c0_g1::Rhum_TRINITY_DN8079_c0_g1_i1::g.26082::m.26082/K04069/pflA, pflC, pflE; pyruvate formate lyase activating enzyme
MPIYPSKHWRRINEKVIQCDVCPNFCKLKEGKRGRCVVRGNEGGRMALYTDGRTSGVCVDPIEKKPLNHFLPGTRVLSFGTIGCNLSCKFCQNWHISHTKDDDRLYQELSPQSVALAAQQHKCESIAFTYNDPVIYWEFAKEVAEYARPLGIKTVAVTAGYMCKEPALDFLQALDAANVDLKAFSRRFYSTVCNAKLEPVLDTLRLMKAQGKWVEITNLMIPGKNDDMDEVRAMCRWLHEHLGSDVPLHFTAFHPDGEMLDTPSTRQVTLIKARAIAKEEGLNHVYTGNVHCEATQSTYCSGCNAALVRRDWYETELYPTLVVDPTSETACCARCGTATPGVFRPARYQNASISRPYSVSIA